MSCTVWNPKTHQEGVYRIKSKELFSHRFQWDWKPYCSHRYRPLQAQIFRLRSIHLFYCLLRFLMWRHRHTAREFTIILDMLQSLVAMKKLHSLLAGSGSRRFLALTGWNQLQRSCCCWLLWLLVDCQGWLQFFYVSQQNMC